MSVDNLTKREAIATAALNALITTYFSRDRQVFFDSEIRQMLARMAVGHADALLHALSENAGVKS